MNDTTNGKPVEAATTTLPDRILEVGSELRAALEGARGCSLDAPTETITIIGGAWNGQRFRPDATGAFVRMTEHV